MPGKLCDAAGDIDDPIGGGEETYETCAETIRAALEARLSEVLG